MMPPGTIVAGSRAAPPRAVRLVPSASQQSPVGVPTQHAQPTAAFNRCLPTPDSGLVAYSPLDSPSVPNPTPVRIAIGSPLSTIAHPTSHAEARGPADAAPVPG